MDSRCVRRLRGSHEKMSQSLPSLDLSQYENLSLSSGGVDRIPRQRALNRGQGVMIMIFAVLFLGDLCPFTWYLCLGEIGMPKQFEDARNQDIRGRDTRYGKDITVSSLLK